MPIGRNLNPADICSGRYKTAGFSFRPEVVPRSELANQKMSNDVGGLSASSTCPFQGGTFAMTTRSSIMVGLARNGLIPGPVSCRIRKTDFEEFRW